MSIPIINGPEGRTLKAVTQMMLAARAAMPQMVAGLVERRFTTGSRLSAGMFVNDRNRPERIKNSDPEVHRHSRPIVKPLLVTTISAEDEPEVELTEDDAAELSLVEPTLVAGQEEEPEPDAPTESEEESVDTDGEGA